MCTEGPDWIGDLNREIAVESKNSEELLCPLVVDLDPRTTVKIEGTVLSAQLQKFQSQLSFSSKDFVRSGQFKRYHEIEYAAKVFEIPINNTKVPDFNAFPTPITNSTKVPKKSPYLDWNKVNSKLICIEIELHYDQIPGASKGLSPHEKFLYQQNFFRCEMKKAIESGYLKANVDHGDGVRLRDKVRAIAVTEFHLKWRPDIGRSAYTVIDLL